MEEPGAEYHGAEPEAEPGAEEPGAAGACPFFRDFLDFHFMKVFEAESEGGPLATPPAAPPAS